MTIETFATKTEDGESYPSEAYLYVPDPATPSSWKLRIWETPDTKVTVPQLGRAAAALGPGFRGQPVQMPAPDRAKAKAKLVSLYKSAGVAAGDIPTYLMAEPSGGDLHVPAPLGVRQKRKMHDMMGMDTDEGPEIEILLEKADSRVKYRIADDQQGWSCAGCRFFDSDDLTCSLVEGTIDPTYVCDLWTPPIGTAGQSAMNEPYQVFVDVGQIFGQDLTHPTWIPFLPKPGKYEHATYGEIEITPDRNRQMVDSVKNHVYQEHIPMDAEHETKLSGAVGYIRDMRMNQDGSADAYVEWTDRGRSLVSSGAFKYVSPEWFRSWRDPATGEVHQNVVAGGAITTRPFFKDKVLRALVASEDGAQIIGETRKEEPMAGEDKDKGTTTPPPEPPPAKAAEPETPITFTEAQVQAKIDEAVQAAEAKTTAAETLAATEKTAREALSTRVTTLEKERRTTRFTDLVLGRGATDGARWVGDAEKHVAMLETLTGAFGEDSDEVKAYTEQQTAIAVQVRESSLFREIGSPATIGQSDPEKALEALARKFAEGKEGMTYEMAYSEVSKTAEGRKLYQEIVSK